MQNEVLFGGFNGSGALAHTALPNGRQARWCVERARVELEMELEMTASEPSVSFHPSNTPCKTSLVTSTTPRLDNGRVRWLRNIIVEASYESALGGLL